jgi:cyclopropane fatty-acyl-phospholipid synthase-like methyltransferase
LEGKRVLEIGCGCGTWAIWAALNGAEKAVGIDPEAFGNSSGDFATFDETIKVLGLSQKVVARACYLHELSSNCGPYDLVMMYNVINHVDEEAVTVLDREPAAASRYIDVLQKLRLRIRPGGWVIVADCARDNFWTRAGVYSPFARHMIDWTKHQNPEIWMHVFQQAGFQHCDLRWSPLFPFGRLTSNRVAQYLTYSHFVVRFRRD